MDTQADLIYSHTGYDVISYFQSAFIEVENTAENAASDVFVSMVRRFECPTNWWASCFWFRGIVQPKSRSTIIKNPNIIVKPST